MDEITDTTVAVAGTDSPPAHVTDETQPPSDESTPVDPVDAPSGAVGEEIAETVAEVTDDPVVEAIADAVAETSPEPAAAEAAETSETAEPAEPVESVVSAPTSERSREEILSEVEQIAGLPDDVDGKQPDDRKLIDRLKALDIAWQAGTEAAAATDTDKDLRRRYDTAKKAYAVARARRAELRAVTRARAGETKRGLLVEAFALARIVDPEKVKVPTPAEPIKREPRRLNRPSPAMFAKRPTPAETPAPDVSDPVVPETSPDALMSEAVVPDAEPTVTEPAAAATTEPAIQETSS